MSENFSLLLSNTNRSIQYLKTFEKSGIFPKKIVYLDNKKKNNILKKIFERIKSDKKCYFKIFKSNNINDNTVVRYLLNIREKNIVYSGYPGSIITNNHLLNKKNLLHSHSGRLPDFRGSTTIYYSLLKNKTIYCSTFIMRKKIDSGKILLVKKYPLPKNILNIDSSYDHLIRAKNMLEVIKNLRNLKIINKKDKKTLSYYVIHPALRTITLNKKY